MVERELLIKPSEKKRLFQLDNQATVAVEMNSAVHVAIITPNSQIATQSSTSVKTVRVFLLVVGADAAVVDPFLQVVVEPG